MSLKFNIAANFLSQFYSAFIGILLIPYYLRLMGAEAYGLVAFFMMLQVWFQLLDFGLTATVSRETARYLGGGLDALSLRRLLRSLEGCFWAIGVVAAAVIAWASPGIASRWLNVGTLPADAVVTSLALMGFTVSTRWVAGLYRAAISGLERQVWLSLFNIVIVTARFVGVVPVLLYIDAGPVPFFVYQAIVCVIELIALLACAYRLVPSGSSTWIRWSWAPLKSVFGFSATVAVTSAIWVLITQTDKLLISKFLPLQDYGYFTAAVLVASAVSLISGPITTALLPRLTRLSQQPDDAPVVLLYRQATQGITALASAASLVMALFAEQLLWAWTGDAVFARGYAPVLALYALGNGFLALAAFPYYIQYARGDLRLHFIGNIVFVILLMPAIAWATWQFGAIGAGTVWITANALFFVGWAPVVHRRLLPELHRRWLLHDVLGVMVLPLAAVPVLWWARSLPLGRAGWGAFLVAAGLLLLGLGLARASLLTSQLSPLIATRARSLWRTIRTS